MSFNQKQSIFTTAMATKGVAGSTSVLIQARLYLLVNNLRTSLKKRI